jgi:GT2 family glycosyltransferase
MGGGGRSGRDQRGLAPAVVAVVVTCNPGPWLEETLSALRRQDYPSLSVLVIDAASEDDPTSRVAAVFPTAYVRRLLSNHGFAASANRALGLVQGASHLLLCHDDVAPEPDAVRLLVEEAFRSNAGVVAPKLVDWHDPERLLQVGMGADRTGAPAERVEQGELDQAQHDAVRDVFFAPGACTLIRADLFAALSGFDPAIALYGEDLDRSWRAHLAGARVVVAPAARVRHLEALSRGLRPLPRLATRRAPLPSHLPAPLGSAAAAEEAARVRLRLGRRHELRTVLKNYPALRLVVVLPRLALLWLAELGWDMLHGRLEKLRALPGAVWWNLVRLRRLWLARASVRRLRVTPDREIRRLQVSGSARLTAMVRSLVSRMDERSSTKEALSPGATPNGGSLVVGPDVPSPLIPSAFRATSAHGPVEPAPLSVGPGPASPTDAIGDRWGLPRGAPLVFWVLVIALVLFGSRALLGQPFPLIGQLAPLPGWSGLLHTYADGYRPTGLGSSAASPLAFALLGLGSLLLAGGSGLLQHLLVLGTLPLAGLGAWRLATPLPSRWSRMAAAAAYLAVPLPYDSLAQGNWSALIAYAGMPFLLARLCAAIGLAPFAPAPAHGSEGPSHLVHWARKVVGLGVLVAVVGSFAPTAGLVLLLSGLGLLLGGALAGEGRRGARAVALALGGLGVAVLLTLPWSFDVVSSAGHLGGFGPQLTGHLTVWDLLRFRTGPTGGSPLSWAVMAAGLVPLLIGRGWRLSWAIRFWTVALLCVAVAYLGQRGWLGASPPGADILLSGAAAALAASVGLGVAALSMDLSAFRFGWRQLISVVGACGLLLGLLPALWATVGGRWDLPAGGIDQVLGWMPSGASHGTYRVLWVGQPATLPLGSWRLSDGVSYATSEDGLPNGAYLWPSPDPGPARLLATDITLAGRGLTTQLGHLLAPMAIRYLVIPEQLAPGPGMAPAALPPRLLSGLLAQGDLRQVPSDPSVLVLENTAFAPERVLLAPAAARASQSPNPAVAQTTALRGAKPVLPGQGTRLSGAVPRGRVFLSEASSEWQLMVGGRPVASHQAFGWARSFVVSRPGPGVLQHRAPAGHEVALIAELVLALLSVGFLVWSRPARTVPAPVALGATRPPDGMPVPARRGTQVLSGAGADRERR